MIESVIASKTIIVIVAFVSLFAAERLFRAASPPKSPRRLFRNGGLWLLTILISPLIVVPLTAWGVNNTLWTRPQLVPETALVVLLIDLLLLDLWTYFVHRAYHRVPVMWRLHEVHHRDEFLDTTSAFRFHAGEVILSACLRLAPIMLLAPTLETVILFETILICAALFHHSNLRLLAPLEKAASLVFVTPSIHWVHHHAVERDTNSNYGTVFSFWDRVFRSKSKANRRLGMKIGIEGAEDKGFFALLLMPFVKRQP
ncbi:MAG: sterol desaturase family protein [Marinicaulis sp.]|nr:sterol desaturase family protein [Marinicaulis sp.]